MPENQQNLFKPGPLYHERFAIVDLVKQNMRSGDILYRASDAKGPLGLPFTRLVASATNSEYSHAAIMFVENGEPNVLEVNDQGTLRYRLLDWIDTCYGKTFSIYRLKDLNEVKEDLLLKEIYKFLDEDPDYDLTFSSDDKYYCTESVIEIYRRALNLELDPGSLIKDVVAPWKYYLLRGGSEIFSIFGTSLPFDKRLYFVGNEKRGMMSSPLTQLVIKV